MVLVAKFKYNNQIHLTVKSVMFFAMQKPRPFSRQVIWALSMARYARMDNNALHRDGKRVSALLFGWFRLIL